MSVAQLWLQTLVIAFVVAWALAAAVRRLLPVPSRRWQARVVDALIKAPLPARLRHLLRHAQPKASTGASCGDGCSSCGGCGAVRDADKSGPVADGARPLLFRPRAPSSTK